MDNKNYLTGQCHCGYITYGYSGDIVRSSYCDCHGCQRASGTLKVPFITVNMAMFKLITGELSHFHNEEGDRCDKYGTWYFCSRCGTHIYWKSHQGTEFDLFTGTLDDTEFFQDAL